MPSYVRAGIRKCARIRALSKGRLFEWVWDRAWRIVGEFKTNYVAYKSVNKE